MEVNTLNIEQIVKQVLQEMKTGSKGTEAAVKPASNGARAAVLTGPKKIEVKEFPIPKIGDDEILVKVEGCGICGTDVHEYKGDPFGLIPIVLGHEGTGVIVELGKNVKEDSAGKKVQVGDKIVTSVVTGEDSHILMTDPSRANLSDDMQVYGLIPDDAYHLNGWFADYIVLRKGSSFFQVNDMNLNLRLLIEPAAVVVHAVERAKTTGLLKFNSKVVVQGCGPIGLMLLAVVRTMGVNNIIAVDGDDQRLQMAKRLGADQVINFKNYKDTEALVQAIKDTTGGKGADFAFQCTGVPQAAANIWKFVRRGGGLCEVGFFVDNGPCTINPHWDICQKEITAVGSWVYTLADYPTTFDFLKRAQQIGLPVEELITHRFSLDQMNEAMEVNMKLEGIKIAYINDRF